MKFLATIGEWLVLLPLWRRVLKDPSWRVFAAIATGIAWFVLIIVVGAVAGSGEEEDNPKEVSAMPSPTVTESTPTPQLQRTEAPTPTSTPIPEPTPTLEPTPQGIGDGTYIVGQDAAPGDYWAPGGDFCYWERLSGFGGSLDEILANDASSGSQIVTILPADAGFSTDGCGFWQKGLPSRPDASASLDDGTYVVPSGVAPGTWRSGGSEGCYWERLRGFWHDLDAIIANNFSDSQEIVTIAATDAGFSSSGCGTWTKIQ